jgi:hypothetical protein
LSNLDFETITSALTMPDESGHRLIVFNRLGWYFYYFGAMGSMFVICLVAPGSDLASHVGSVFAFIGLIVPLSAAVRPILSSWSILLFDRMDLEVPTGDAEEASESDASTLPESRDDTGDKEVEPLDISDSAKDGQSNCFEASDEPVHKESTLPDDVDEDLECGVACRNFVGPHTLSLLDPISLLNDETWPTFLRSGFTGHARPQRRRWQTWIVACCVFVWLIVVISLDVVRLAQALDARQLIGADIGQSLHAVSTIYQLDFLSPEVPPTQSIIAALVVRIIIVIAIFPLTVLSHHATLLIPKRWSLLKEHHSTVRVAKIIGFVLFAIGFIALIAGASVAAVHPWLSPDSIMDSPLTVGSERSWTNENPHSLCRESVSDWSLVQLAVFPLLAESRGTAPAFYADLARITGIDLFENQTGSGPGFPTTSIIAFNRTAKKLAVGMPAMPFVANLGIILENSLTYYYPMLMDLVVPFYGLASDLFLSNLLSVPTEILVSGILGPNRLSESWLNDATVSVTRELDVVSEVIEALGLSADRPVMVGHGANGLIMKALQFEKGTDPWRVAFESPMLLDSPMATLANLGDLDSTLSRVVNFYSEDSFYALDDGAALVNNRVPPYSSQSRLIPPHSFETFCFTVAACGDDPVLDHLCESVFQTPAQFGNLCTKVGRPRIRSKVNETTAANNN